MSEHDGRVAAGVAPKQQGARRDAGGHFLPGSSGNPQGRPIKTTSTKELGDRLLRAEYLEAMRVIVANLRDPNPWVRERAAEMIMQRADLLKDPAHESVRPWITASEYMVIMRIFEKAGRRKERGEPPRDAFDLTRRKEDAFGPDNIPAPALPAAPDDALVLEVPSDDRE